ncbi:MAG: ORF6N domain-containing protein, partial [Tannerellaceae bacterium]|nr:ORF6N domain-containing protein [Tannerellaceae bacterium]
KYSKYLPYAFSEQGVAQLSSVLNSPYAIDVNIKIIRAFVAVRTYLSEYASTSKEIARIWEHVKALEKISEENLKAINDLSEDTGRNFDDIYIALSELANKQKSINEVANKPRRPIGYIQPKEENRD